MTDIPTLAGLTPYAQSVATIGNARAFLVRSDDSGEKLLAILAVVAPFGIDPLHWPLGEKADPFAPAYAGLSGALVLGMAVGGMAW